jgi:hypothetical protein
MQTVPSCRHACDVAAFARSACSAHFLLLLLLLLLLVLPLLQSS